MPFRNTWGQPSYLTALIGVSCSLVDSASYFHINKYKKSDCSQAAFRGFHFTAFGKDGSREPVMVMTPTKLSFPVPQKSPALPQSPLCAAFGESATCLSPLTQKGPSSGACTKPPLYPLFCFFTGQADVSSVCDSAFHRNPFLNSLKPVFYPRALSNRSYQRMPPAECPLPTQQGLKGLLPYDPSSWVGLWVTFLTENLF